MRHIATYLATEAERPRRGTSRWKALADTLLRRLLPQANPDFEKLYPQVRLWWVEIDQAGVPRRELGFDAEGSVIVGGPMQGNTGFWTDSAMRFNEPPYQAVSAKDFEAAWRLMEKRYGEMPRRPRGTLHLPRNKPGRAGH
jgi:hypothetical protein